MRPWYRAEPSRAMRSAAWFTQPTVFRIHTSLRVPTRPLGRLYPMKVVPPLHVVERGTGGEAGSYAYSSPPSRQVLRLCQCTHAPGAHAGVGPPGRKPEFMTGSARPRAASAAPRPAG